MYKITIVKIEENVKLPTRDYKKIRDTGGEDDGPQYAYVEDFEIKDVETQVYQQRVEDIDLVQVINAINKQSQGDQLNG